MTPMTRRLMMTLGLAALCLVLWPTIATAYTVQPDSLYKHIEILAHDSLEGRLVGSDSEYSAAQYIARIFAEAGLEPDGDNGGWFEPFTFTADIAPVGPNTLSVNGTPLEMGAHYLPLPWSGNGPLSLDQIIDVGYGLQIRVHGLQRDDYAAVDVTGKAVLIRRGAPPSDNPQIDLARHAGIVDKINTAAQHGAAAVLLITPPETEDTLILPDPAAITAREIPVLFLKHAALQALGLSLEAPRIHTVEGIVTMQQVIDTGYNVAGYLTGRSDTSIIVGAHYDHIGRGDRGSLYRGDERMIHNGADDNASGVSGLLELARHFASRTDSLHFSMTFAAFSGEESGLLGSKHYVKQRKPGPGNVKLMANMDMIGRLRPEKKGLIIYGAGTALELEHYLDSLSALEEPPITLTVEKSGIGASDHTSFYNREIPALHLFTGPHEDYNKPSDDAHTINIDGLHRVAGFLADFLWYFQRHKGGLSFQKVSAPPMSSSRAQFSVTLGIMPDYAANVEGVLVESAIPERPGAEAGIQEGDIIVKMGRFPVRDIYDYMSALAKFRTGDSITVVVERDKTQHELSVVF
jgi:aminopeptidase YwaD